MGKLENQQTDKTKQTNNRCIEHSSIEFLANIELKSNKNNNNSCLFRNGRISKALRIN